MRLVKPMRLGLLPRVFENAGQSMLTVTGLVFFGLTRPKAILHEVMMWKTASTQLGQNAPIDMCMPKTRGEVIVDGSAWVIGDPRPGASVKLRVARPEADGKERVLVDKELYVIGDRTWGTLGATTPEPFVSMPLTWTRAFGGEGFADNPVGRGHKPVTVGDKQVIELPNVEHPKHLVKSPSDKPSPSGFSSLDITWPQRMKRTGTYDTKWLETRFPGYPEDFDWEFWNAAPDDQRIEGFFHGDEIITVEGMNPSSRVVQGSLPPVSVRVFVVKRGAPDELIPVLTKIDTIHVFPNVGQAIAVFRGTLPVNDDDGADVATVLGAIDDPADSKPISHYHAELMRRTDKKTAGLHALSDKGLVPAWIEKPSREDEAWDDMSELVKLEQLQMERGERRRENLIQEVRERAIEGGLAPEKFDDAMSKAKPHHDIPELPDDTSELPAFFETVEKIAAEAVSDLEKKKDKIYAEARELAKSHGHDFDKILSEAEADAAGPPKFSAEAELGKLRNLLIVSKISGDPRTDLEAKLDDPAFVGQLRDAEANLLKGYRFSGHFKPSAPRGLTPEAAEELRRMVLERHIAGHSLEGMNLTAANLENADLRGIDLRQALLESANLKGADLRGADLRGTMLARAELDGADLREAKLDGANFGKVVFGRANLDGVSLKGCVFYEAELDGASFRGADLTDAQFFFARFGKVDFSGAKAEKLVILEANLVGSDFRRAKLTQVAFLKCRMDEVMFDEAHLERVTFCECPMQRSSFKLAKIDRMGFLLACDLTSSNFLGVDVKLATFRDADLTETEWSGAKADDCDFSGANLTRAKLYRASLQRSLFVRTKLNHADLKSANMTNAIVQKADISSADMRGVNLFRADMAKIKADQGTRLDDANLRQIRTVFDPQNQKIKRPT